LLFGAAKLQAAEQGKTRNRENRFTVSGNDIDMTERKPGGLTVNTSPSHIGNHLPMKDCLTFKHI
jgi:hypothetical protein